MSTDQPPASLARSGPTQPPIRVLIVDDHAVVRQGLRTFLELQATDPTLPIEVAGEATNGAEAVDQARTLQPDVILLDLVMPGIDGVAATGQILAVSPQSRVMILTSFGEEDKIIPAIRAGAQGYLLKDIPPDDLVRAVRQVYAGQVQLHPEVAKKLMSAVAAKSTEPPPGAAKAGLDELTERETEVLHLIAAGLNNHAIAERMVISEKTVKTHVSSILAKLRVQDRTQAAIYALRHGLTPDGT